MRGVGQGGTVRQRVQREPEPHPQHVRPARPTGRLGRRGATIALTAGLATAVIGGWIIAAAEGGPGTGYGIVGGYVDLAMARIALLLGALALLRSRRTT
ncbi:DUF6223 family protein [Nonomuraea salmonea]|uniref:DUF6223 family protein n=1 Tax=Nonomuraea salmonea TaxID=46181 RepID=A0ABV5NHD4_9ACTN